VVTVGDDAQKTPNLAAIYVKLVNPDQRTLTEKQLMALARTEIAAHQPKDLKIDVSEVPLFVGGLSWPVTYELTGPDLDRLTEYSQRALALLRQVPGAVDATSSVIPGKPEVSVTINREKAADLGVSVNDVALALRLLVGGVDVSSYLEQGNEYDIHVRADQAYRADVDGLAMMTVPSARLGAVPLTEVVRLEQSAGLSQINHTARRRQVMLFSNVGPESSESAVGSGLEAAVKTMNLPSGYALAAFGKSKEMARAQKTFMAAFALSIIFMYLILAAQFESWLHPITILLALPLTLPFALVSLLLFGQSLNIFSTLGILVLFGVIKKNSILQIDHINQLRAKGVDRLEAILRGNRDRLRPILMTTLAFVAGMVPLIFAHGIGGGFNRASAGGIVGGQILSLLLTLLATPVAYSLFDDASSWLGRRVLRRSRNVAEEQGTPEEAEAAA
jgi:multidrug efflux pump subunit AcrB